MVPAHSTVVPLYFSAQFEEYPKGFVLIYLACIRSLVGTGILVACEFARMFGGVGASGRA
jgi:hypothetical protein